MPRLAATSFGLVHGVYWVIEFGGLVSSNAIGLGSHPACSSPDPPSAMGVEKKSPTPNIDTKSSKWYASRHKRRSRMEIFGV